MAPHPARLLTLPRRRALANQGNTRTRVISGFTAANFYITPVSFGFGGSAGAFGVATIFRLKALPTVYEVLRRKKNTSGVARGWEQSISAAGFINSSFGNGSSFVGGTPIPLSGVDVGRVHLFVSRLTGIPGTIDNFLNGFQSTGVALSAFTVDASSTPERIGIDEGSGFPAPSFEFIAGISFLGAPTAAQLIAYMLAARAAKDLPAALPGATIYQRYSLPAALGAGGFTDGQDSPSSLASLGSAAIVMNRQGTGLVTREYLSTDGAKSYGLTLASPSAVFRTAIPGGLGGAGPFVCTVRMRFDQASMTATQVLVGRGNNSNAGWFLYTAVGNYLAFIAYEGAASYKQCLYYPPNLEPGRDQYVTCEYTGTALRLYYNGVLVASIAMTGTNTMVPYNGAMTVCNLDFPGAYACTQLSWFGLTGKDGTTTDAEIAANVSASRIASKLLRMAGATRHYDPTQDIVALGGPASATPLDTIAERVSGVDHVMRLDPSPHYRARHTERAHGYEDTPVSAGFTPTGTAYYDSTASGHDGGAAAGKSVALLFRIDSRNVNKARDLLSIGTTPAQTMFIRASGTMSILQAGWFNGTTWSNTTPIAIGAADVGTMLLFVTVFDKANGRAKSYWKRAEVSSPGAVMTSYAPSAAQYLRLGHLNMAAAYPTQFAEEITFFGAATFDGVWDTYAVQQLFDGVTAEDDLVMPYDGMAHHHWSMKQAIGATGVLPATVADLAGSSPLSIVGAPSYQPHYAHAPKWAA